MALSQRLQIRQSQALVMTPQLMQAIKLLQLSNLDLAAYVDAELERNPLLERAEEERAATTERAAEDAVDDSSASADDWDDSEADSGDGAPAAAMEFGPEPAFDGSGEDAPTREAVPDAPGYSEWSGVRAAREDGDYNLEAFVEAETTLVDHLTEQMLLAITDPAQRLIARYLIDMVDEAGYFTGSVADVAEKLGAPIGEVENVLTILQTFDPSGVCARNLTESLSIQLRERDRFDPAMQALVAHLPLLAKRDLPALRKICGVDEEDLADMIAEIRRLNPKPGLAFGSAPVQPVIPDVFVRQAADGSWLVELNSDTLPKVLISQSYYTTISKTARNDGDKAFLTNCLQTASWLVRALDQRAKTILKVSSEIVRQQDAFLAHGVHFLKPLNLKTIAEAIGMHESTVSRVTANKYMATSRGIFELKYFFTSAIAAADGGDAHSAEAVRHRIKQMIDAESADDVLSDETIVDKLKDSGIDLARRTVAKYREALRIPSSVQRRREKQSVSPGITA
jgi:RNA polymerase sigma-54 factor